MRPPDDDDDDDALFDVAAVPPPAGGENLRQLEVSLAALGIGPELSAVAEQARTGARALDAALRGKNPAYAVASLYKPYHDVLTALGIGGTVAGDDAAEGAQAKLLEVFGSGPRTAPEVRDSA